MGLYEKIVAGEEKLSLVGLGYVGMPIAVAFARKIKVIGYDLNEKKIELYRSGVDPTCEVGNDVVKSSATVCAARKIPSGATFCVFCLDLCGFG